MYDRQRAMDGPEGSGMLTENQQRVSSAVDDLAEAGNWLGLSALESEANNVAIEVRAEMPSLAAEIYSNLGQCFCRLEQYDKGFKWLEQTRAIFEEIGNRGNLAATCGNLGFLYYKLGQYEKAISAHEQTRTGQYSYEQMETFVNVRMYSIVYRF